MNIIKFKLRYLFIPSFCALLGGIYALIGAKQGAVFQWMFGLGFLGFIGCALSASEWGRRWSMKHWKEMERQKGQPPKEDAKPTLWIRFWLSRPVMVILIALFVVVIFLRLQQADWQIQWLP